MSHFKQFSYPDISRRWMILFAIFLTFFSITILLSDSALIFKQYLPYYPVIRIILFMTLLSFLAGNLVGKLIYSSFTKYRIINITVSFILFLMLFFYFFKTVISGETFSHFNLYVKSRYLTSLIIIAPSFFSGMINCYFAKISAGDFIDEKNLLSRYLIITCLAIAAGISLSLISHLIYPGFCYFGYISVSMAFLAMILIIFVNIPFIPEALIAQHYPDDDHVEQEMQFHRDDLFYTYTNFSYITIYVFLGLIAFNKFFGDFYYYNFMYVSVILISMILGIIMGAIKKFSSWHVYSEMLFPIFFLSYLFLLYNYENKIHPFIGFLFLILPSLIFGFSIKQTILNITYNFKHEKRFSIINFSLFILPIPIIIAASLVGYTNLFFFLILYVITLLNIIIPGLFLFNSSLSSGKKLFYFFFSLLFIPSIIFMHLYYKIPLNSKPFVDNITNFELLRNTNFNLPYINERGEIKKSGSTIFYLSESTIRNLKRAAAVTSLFCDEESKVMIIDSNQKFFRNPLFGFYKNSIVIDNVPSEFISNSKLPISGRELYVAQEKEILNFLIDDNTQYHSIIDSPNILDQNFYPFRFSKDYYLLAKKRLTENGVYINIIDLQLSNYELISKSLSAISEVYKHHLVFIFSNIAVVISSDNSESLKINRDSINRITKIIENNSIYGLIFYNEIHPFNNIIFNDLNIFQQFLSSSKKINPYIYSSVEIKNIPEQLSEFYFSYKIEWIDSLFSDEKENSSFISSFKSELSRNTAILNLLKRTEYAESVNAYDQETDLLFQLKKYTPYNDDLKKYLQLVLEYKENYYYIEALRLEKEKKWDDAAILYRAILTMNSNNFDANYRFGLLYITLQDLNNAFKYLDTALKLNKNHPQVLYQMGILLFSSDKFKESIEYLEKAKELGINTATLYLYLGISYEKTNQLEKAHENLEKAVMLDPGDAKLKSVIDQLNKKITVESDQGVTEEKKNMSDDEQDEEIKIPVNKKAIKARLKDNEE
ncbi:MAG TPA: tetratricopeptide repeat protein [Spirochaetota bacterium]|nr:tetratricopeptide repeat protein [Spirochaetota bacterium]